MLMCPDAGGVGVRLISFFYHKHSLGVLTLNGSRSCALTMSHLGGIVATSQQSEPRPGPSQPGERFDEQMGSDLFSPEPGKGQGKTQGGQEQRILSVKTLSQTCKRKRFFWRVPSMFLQDIKKEERLSLKIVDWPNIPWTPCIACGIFEKRKEFCFENVILQRSFCKLFVGELTPIWLSGWSESSLKDVSNCSNLSPWFFFFVQTIEVQFSSVTQSCPTLCNPRNRSTPGL